jgi:hypothetical protein
MLTILSIVAAVLLFAIAVILILAANKPDEFRVTRSASIQAPPEKIAPYINDLRRHVEWSPWEKMDPGMMRSFSGNPAGVGQHYDWDSKKQVGAGSLHITEITAARTRMNLDFVRPFKSSNTVEFAFEPKGETTQVTWSMNGITPFWAKIMHVFCNAEKMCGDAFNQGLSDLKTLAEA